jgi:opacity protein-like surface antigen
MKKLLVVFLTLIFVVALSVSAFGLTSPVLTKGHGVVTGMFVSGPSSGVLIGGEFGIIPDLGVGLEVGSNITKVYAKYELNPNLAIMGGVYGTGGGTTDPFLGLNGGMYVSRDFAVLGEIDLISSSGQFGFGYEAGAKYNITKQLDIRGGVRGVIFNGNSTTAVELGVGFKF